MNTEKQLSLKAIQMLGDLLEEKETELSIKGSKESLDALNELWQLYQSVFVD
jgi:hypothetical protein